MVKAARKIDLSFFGLHLLPNDLTHQVTAMGKKWKCDGLSLEDCPNSYTSSGQNTFFQCG
jgi:hypothetical protein